MNKLFDFKILKKDAKTKARVGELRTPHGTIDTPAFIPCGTKASVKSLTPQDLNEIGVQVVLGNTYHLHLRPGEKIVKEFGGLGKFMGWNGPTLTDSGGFQVFSLGVALEQGVAKLLQENDEDLKQKPRLNKITEEGVTFQSHLDGSSHILTPESSISIQETIGADLIVGFDDLESPKYSYAETKKSLERTNRWLLRSKKSHRKSDQLLYGVTHGGRFKDLRIESAKFADKNFDAIALGGAHSSKENMYEVVKWTVGNTDDLKPKHMLGIGEVDDIFNIVSLGVDTFDCVIPTRMGRMGFVFVSPPEGNLLNRFRIDISKEIFAKDKNPLDKNCQCLVCRSFTRGYVHHLFRARELLAYRLASYHNVYFLTDLMKKIREAIIDNSLLQLRNKWSI